MAEIPDPQVYILHKIAFLAFGGCPSKPLSQAQKTGLGEWSIIHNYDISWVFIVLG